MGNIRKLSASCVVIKDNNVLLVKHTYGAAKGKYLILGGCSEEGEMPGKTAEREVFEETGVHVQAKELIAVRFTTQEVWCIFRAEYISGIPASDGLENEEALFMPAEEAIESDNVVDTTKEILKSVLQVKKNGLEKSSFVNQRFDSNTWQLYV